MRISTGAASRHKHLLLRRLWSAQGRCDAFQFALDAEGDVSRVEEELGEREAIFSRLARPGGPTAPGASPRFYAEAYIAALREALDIMRSADPPSER